MGAEGGNPGAVDGFGIWDRAEGQGAASLILCILHDNTSILPSSSSVAEYNSSSSNVTQTKKKSKSIFFCFRPICTETKQTMTDLHRVEQILRDTVQSCTARHPSVTSVTLWTSGQLCQDCPDSPGFADESKDVTMV